MPKAKDFTNAKTEGWKCTPHVQYPCLRMNRGCCGGYNMTCALPYFQHLVVLPNKKSQNPRKSYPILAMCCENNPQLWAFPTDPRYCVGTL